MENTTQTRKLAETKAYYEDYPFIEGGETRIKWWQEYMRDFLPDEEIKGRLMVDVGSSIGEITRGLSNRGARMVCVDVTQTALKRNRQINPDATLFNGSAIDLPFADGTFDHSISIGVLMITPDIKKGFREISRVTRPGGTVVLFIYNYWCYLNFMYKLWAPVRKTVKLESVPSFVVKMMQPFVKGHLGTQLDENGLRRLLGDKLWTPHASFHTLREMKRWGEEVGMTMFKWKRFYHHYANVMAFRKEGQIDGPPREELRVKCLECHHQPLELSAKGYSCVKCGTLYEQRDGIHRFINIPA